jgi:hypothetical protein
LATKLGGKVFAPPEVVVFEDARKKSRKWKELKQKQTSTNLAGPVENAGPDDPELSMKQAR